jgi:hypothetical protein
MNNLLNSKTKKVSKIAFPFKIDIDPMERLIVVSLKDNPEIEMIEPQVFDDPINGKGMRIILYRKDKKVDIYWEHGVIVNMEMITIGAGIEHFKETVIQPSRFEITKHGVDVHVAFIDAQGRTVELKIMENSSGINPFAFLAPVGKDIDNPKRLFLAHMLSFDFVREKDTYFSCKIGDRALDPMSFPIRRNFKKVMFIRYSGFPVVGTFNPSMNEPLIFETETPGQIEVDGMVLHVDKDHRIKKVCVDQKMKKIELDFPHGFPNLYDIKDDTEEKGEWSYNIADMTIIGGTYFLARTNSNIDIRIDVTQNWKPTNLPLSFKLFTWFVRSFRNWPTTYIWNGSINLDNNTLVGRWSRNNQ